MKSKTEYTLFRLKATEGSQWRVILAAELLAVLPTDKQDFIIDQIKLLLPVSEEDSSESHPSN